MADTQIGIEYRHQVKSQYDSIRQLRNRFTVKRADSNNISFHEDDKAVRFDNLEYCFLFKNDLDHEVEEYELERDNTPEFLMVKEPTTITQMAEAHTSLCIPITQK